MKLAELQAFTQAFPNADSLDTQRKIQEYMQKMGVDLSAFYQELEMTSRFVDTHRDISYSNAHMQLHSHAFYELLYCINSCNVEYLVGSERYRLQRGDLVFVPPGISHRPLLPEQMDEPYMRYVLWLSPEFMKLYESLLPYPFTERQNHASMLRTQGTRWERLGDLFHNGVQEAQQQSNGWEAAVIGNTMSLLAEIKRATDDRAAHPLKAEKPKLLDRIVAYIERNYPSNITVRSLGRQFYISSSTVSHLFQQKLGVSCYQYITQRRLIAAKALIERKYPMGDVALQSGFSDYSGFYRAFKREYGISPRQYRSLQETDGKTP